MEYEKLSRELEQVRHGTPVAIGFLLDRQFPRERLLAIREELTAYGKDALPNYARDMPFLMGLEVSDYQRAQALLERLNPRAAPETRLEGIVVYETFHSELQAATRYGRPY